MAQRELVPQLCYFSNDDTELAMEQLEGRGPVGYRNAQFFKRGELECPKGGHVFIVEGSPNEELITEQYEGVGCRVTILARPEEEQAAAESDDDSGDGEKKDGPEGDKGPEAPEADKKPTAPPKKSRSRAAK